MIFYNHLDILNNLKILVKNRSDSFWCFLEGYVNSITLKTYILLNVIFG
jgi:hypothetical protein